MDAQSLQRFKLETKTTRKGRPSGGFDQLGGCSGLCSLGWEKASHRSRMGKSGKGRLEGKLWPWGDQWDLKNLNSWEGGVEGTQPVGSYSANQYGLYDMAGNVWEWCADWYAADFYQNSPTQEPQGPDKGINKVVRGGSWSNMAFTSRCGERKKMNPRSRFNSIGFRCVKDQKK